MDINLRAKAIALCELLANSFYDRDPHSKTPVFFSLNEIELIEEFLTETIEEVREVKFYCESLATGIDVV